MARVKRPRHVLIHLQDGARLDLPAVRADPDSPAVALSLLTGEAYPLGRDELELLLAVPADRWVEAPDAERARGLSRAGLLVSDEDDGELAALRQKDELLTESGWHLYAALYHFMTRWRNIDLRSGDEIGEFPRITAEMLREFVALRGCPPDPFHALERPAAVHALPLVRRAGGLYDALDSRKTTRGFARESTMAEQDLGRLLYEVWGCHGTAPMVDDLFALRRTSPSGGGLHPIEVYPLVTNVDGVGAGLYHYRSSDHALELVEGFSEQRARDLALRAVCGQAYLASAHVLFVMTARFDRLHWKYRKHQKAYASVLVDAGHLSQTMYLVAAELGLGAFVTLAFNSEPLEERLQLDGVSESVLAVAGSGPRRPERSPFEPDFSPYAVPR